MRVLTRRAPLIRRSPAMAQPAPYWLGTASPAAPRSTTAQTPVINARKFDTVAGGHGPDRGHVGLGFLDQAFAASDNVGLDADLGFKAKTDRWSVSVAEQASKVKRKKRSKKVGLLANVTDPDCSILADGPRAHAVRDHAVPELDARAVTRGGDRPRPQGMSRADLASLTRLRRCDPISQATYRRSHRSSRCMSSPRNGQSWPRSRGRSTHVARPHLPARLATSPARAPTSLRSRGGSRRPRPTRRFEHTPSGNPSSPSGATTSSRPVQPVASRALEATSRRTSRAASRIPCRWTSWSSPRGSARRRARSRRALSRLTSTRSRHPPRRQSSSAPLRARTPRRRATCSTSVGSPICTPRRPTRARCPR